MESPTVNIMWFRRDLRLDDNRAFFEALKAGEKVLPIFIFDPEILGELKNKADRRVDFIFQALEEMNDQLAAHNSAIKYYYGKPAEIFEKICKDFNVKKVFANEDYEPYAIARDGEVSKTLAKRGAYLYLFKDQVIFAKDEILKADGSPYTIYSPYAKAWHERYSTSPITHYTSEDFLQNLYPVERSTFALEDIGFSKTDLDFRRYEFDLDLIKAYSNKRNKPALDATSKISVHLRFGTVSIRETVKFALEHSFKFYRELIWRDFFAQVLYHFPHTQHRAFKPAYDHIQWKNSESDFALWMNGTTGFPLVDAGMRELNATGFMHNRVRMVVASFLIKDLLIDWRWGEAYFAEKLLDYDLSQNIGNWQWCAGCGCDAAPYFRIFNPQLQLEKFDPKYEYVKRWVPEYGTAQYPEPMVDHKTARAVTIDAFKKALLSYN